MLNFVALLTKGAYWRLHSLILKWILRMSGVNVGTNFLIQGVPKLKVRGKASNITIGNNVTILGDIDIRNRENGKIVFRDNVTIEHDCRFVSARDGTIEIGEDSIVTAFAIINGGADVIIGKKCIIGPRASINANEHQFIKDKPIRDQGFIHAPVYIEDDCWLATNVVINKGVRLRKGSIIGSNAVVANDTEPYSINGGVPARKIGERT